MIGQTLRRRVLGKIPLYATLSLSRTQKPLKSKGHHLEVSLSLIFWTFLQKTITIELVVNVKYRPLPSSSHEEKAASADTSGPKTAADRLFDGNEKGDSS